MHTMLPVFLILFHEQSVVSDQRVSLPIRRRIGIGIVTKTTQHWRDLVDVTTDVRGHGVHPPTKCFEVDWLYYLVCRLLHPTDTERIMVY